MCGISGIINLNRQGVDSNILAKMSKAIAHRGPDDAGFYIGDHIGFAHQRLSIIDTSVNGHQPMFSTNQQFVIIFNGEIYNYVELRKELISKGYRFKTETDTEVLINMFVEYGSEMLHKLNGMFVFAIYNKQNQKVFIARDRMGVKPFYYYIDKSRFLFASEPKAIFAAGVKPTVARENINEWLMFRHVSGKKTMFEGVTKLLPGHFMIITPDEAIQSKRWWNLSERIANHPEIKNPKEWFASTFDSAVKYRMVSDVPVGVLLSGGLDSSSVTLTLKANGFSGINTFNVGFRDYVNDETAIAKKFSESLEYPFHNLKLENDELHQALIDATIHYDEPLVHMNDPQILAISRLAKKHVKVLLSGEGADEILGGYIRYKVFKYMRVKSLLKSFLSITPNRYKNARIHKLERYLNFGGMGQLIMSNSSNYFESDFNNLGLNYLGISNDYRAQVLKEARSAFPNSNEKQLLYYDQHTYLQSLNDRNDRATMGAGIECREPFQDYRLAEGVGSLNSSWLLKGKKGKYLLKSSMNNRLPSYILNYKKVGFGVPWQQLIKQSQSLSHEYSEFLISDIFEEIGLPFSSANIIRSNHADFAQLQMQLFTYYIWKKYYFKHIDNLCSTTGY